MIYLVCKVQVCSMVDQFPDNPMTFPTLAALIRAVTWDSWNQIHLVNGTNRHYQVQCYQQYRHLKLITTQ